MTSDDGPERALIFDMDGVLIDSEPLWRQAEIEVFDDVGLKITEQDCLMTMGLRIDDAVAFWYDRSPWAGRSCRDVETAIVERVAELIRDTGTPLPGVQEAIQSATDRGFQLGLASSSPNFLIHTVLDHFGLREVFAAARSAEKEPYGKPHPAVYLSTAEALSIHPRQCIAIEDSVNGVISAVAAQMTCIAIPDTESRNDPRFAIAVRQIKSLEFLGETLDELEA